MDLLYQQLRDGDGIVLYIAQAVENHGDLRLGKGHGAEVFLQRLAGGGHEGRVEGAADLQRKAPAGAFFLRQGGGLFHGGLLAAQDQLPGAVVVGNDHAAQGGSLIAGGLERDAVQAQHRHHGGFDATGCLFHGAAPEGHQLYSGGGVEHPGGVQGGILAQGKTRGGRGDDALFPQHRRHAGGEGHHAGLRVAGLVQNAAGVLEGHFLQVEIHLGTVDDGAEGGKGLIQVRTHARVLAALSGV